MSESSFRVNKTIKDWANHIDIITTIHRVIGNKESIINLDNRNISVLPKDFFLLDHRMEINLSHNELTELSPEWSTLHIRSLALDYNILNCVPPVLSSLKYLIWLNLGHNPLKNISPIIGDITSLETLWINCTEIDDLPKEMGKLTNLETLGARGNQLKSFPVDLCYLTNLSWITLANNNIQELPEEFSNLKSLIHFNLSHNCLKKVPSVLSQLEHLEYCDLSFNLIKNVPKKVLLKISHLKCLNLKGNELTDIKLEDLKTYKFVVIDGCDQEKTNHDSETDSEDWENSVGSSELYFDFTDESDDNNMDGFKVITNIAKFSAH